MEAKVAHALPPRITMKMNIINELWLQFALPPPPSPVQCNVTEQ